MRFKRITLLSLVCAVPLAVFGEPGGSNKQGGPRTGGGPGGGISHAKPESERGAGGRLTNEWGSEKEREQFRKDLAVFCEANSPNRWNEIIKKGWDKNPGRIGAMAWQYKTLQTLQKEDPKLYEIKVNQIRIQDEEFGVLQAIKDSDKNPEKLTAAELDSKLKEKAEKYVLLRLSERQHRIEALDKLLKKEKEALETDVHDTPALVETRCKELIKQGPSLFPNPGPRRGEGARGDATRPSHATTSTSVP